MISTDREDSCVLNPVQPSRKYLDRPSIKRLAPRFGYLTDSQLARAAGITARHLSGCLVGRYTAGPKVVAGLLAALPGTSAEDFTFTARVTILREVGA